MLMHWTLRSAPVIMSFAKMSAMATLAQAGICGNLTITSARSSTQHIAYSLQYSPEFLGSGVKGGVIAVIGGEKSDLAGCLRANDSFTVLVLETDQAKSAEERQVQGFYRVYGSTGR